MCKSYSDEKKMISNWKLFATQNNKPEAYRFEIESMEQASRYIKSNVRLIVKKTVRTLPSNIRIQKKIREAEKPRENKTAKLQKVSQASKVIKKAEEKGITHVVRPSEKKSELVKGDPTSQVGIQSKSTQKSTKPPALATIDSCSDTVKRESEHTEPLKPV